MLGAEIARVRPDAVVLTTSGWVTTFHHYVAGPAHLATPPAEAPGRYLGDPALARALVRAGRAERIPVLLTESPAVPLDDASVAALRQLIPAADVPVVPLSLCGLADLAEMLRWGRAIAAAVRATNRRVVLAVAGRAPVGELTPRGEPAESPISALGGAGARPLALLLGAVGGAGAPREVGEPSRAVEP
jgi:aromatic ring-opening dioxygenase catalytic subunit (LigB family)